MICAFIDPATGAVFPMVPQPATVAGCALVIQSGTEVTANPFLMSRADASQLGVSIGVLWVTVAVIKTVWRRN